MTYYTYTTDLPLLQPSELKRLGYRTPRSILLPRYLAMNPYFIEFADSIDEVFETLVDRKTEILGDLRNMWVTNPPMEQDIVNAGQLIPFESWSQPERDLLVKQVNALGMKLANAGVLSNDAYQVISRWVGMYWFEKGTENFINFINYCLGVVLSVDPLWTEDYVNFVPAGDPSIGTPVWEGGTWYPTTHVTINATGGLQTLDVKTLISFFYEIANYNLVLQAVNMVYNMAMVADLSATDGKAEIVAMALYIKNQVYLSNVWRFDAPSPPAVTGSVSGYTKDPNSATGTFVLSAPDGWLQTEQGQKIPIYTQASQSMTNPVVTNPQFIGNPALTGVTTISGPVQWSAVQGAGGRTRFPCYTANATTVPATGSTMPQTVVGSSQILLTNPDGFIEVSPGSSLFTPYWL